MLTSDCDIRLYNADGTRKRLPQSWIGAADFEIGERGGNLTGSVTIHAKWEELALTGTDRVDIYVWGRLLYRGLARQSEKSVTVPEKTTLSLYGYMEILNGFLARRCLCYGGATDIGQVFNDLVTTYVKRAGRLPNLIVDTTGVAALGIFAQTFCAKGKTIPAAMNALCDLAPGQLIWGMDVDSLGRDRIYLRPRATSVGYRYTVGTGVSAYLYPVDATTVVNRIFITGGKVLRPNLAPNGSFEDCNVPSQSTTNLLHNGSFEDNNGSTSATDWGTVGNPTLSNTVFYDGGWSWTLDNNPSAPEQVYQDIAAQPFGGLTATLWARCGASAASFYLLFQLRGGGTTLHQYQSANFAAPADGLWHQYTLVWPPSLYPVDATVDTARFVISLTNDSPSGNNLNVDLAAVWPPAVQAAGWEAGRSMNGGFVTLDWSNSDAVPAAYDGDVKIKVVPSVTAAGGFAELSVAADAQISVLPNAQYVVLFYVYVPAGTSASVAVGIREFNGGSAAPTGEQVSGATGLASGGWQQVSARYTTGGGTNKLAPLIRFLTGGAVYYVDGAGVFEQDAPDIYTAGDSYATARDTSAYTAADLGAAAAASIATWGEREAAVSNEAVVDDLTMNAFAKGYLKAYAVPNVQGRLTLDEAAAPVGLDGQVKIIGLPNAPPAISVAKAHYRIGAAIQLELDLSDERPDLALLLRKVTLGAPNVNG